MRLNEVAVGLRRSFKLLPQVLYLIPKSGLGMTGRHTEHCWPGVLRAREERGTIFHLEVLNQAPDPVSMPREEATATIRLNIRPRNL